MRRALIIALATWAGAGCGTKVVDLDPHDASAGVLPATETCFAKQLTEDVRCLYCGPTFQQRACLKCEPISANDSCRQCSWSDSTLPGPQCHQCYDATGTLIKDSCDLVRTDLARD